MVRLYQNDGDSSLRNSGNLLAESHPSLLRRDRALLVVRFVFWTSRPPELRVQCLCVGCGRDDAHLGGASVPPTGRRKETGHPPTPSAPSSEGDTSDEGGNPFARVVDSFGARTRM